MELRHISFMENALITAASWGVYPKVNNLLSLTDDEI